MTLVDLSNLGLASSSTDLLQVWLDSMQAQINGYQPADPTNPDSWPLEYKDAVSTAAMFEDVAQVGVVVPDAIVRAFGTKLYGIPYLTGASATTVIQVTAQDTTGHTLSAGADLLLNGVAFDTTADLVISAGSSTGTVVVAAVTPGTASNGAGNPASFVNNIDWVSAVTALATSSMGVDAESDTDYQSRLGSRLQLQTLTPITATNFAGVALSFQPAAGTDQQEIGRATALDGYSGTPATFVVATTGSSGTLTVTTPPAAGVTAAQGASITGTDIQSGTLVSSATSSQMTLTKTASGTGSNISATVTGTLGNARTVTLAVTDSTGAALNADTKTALAAWLQSLREVNFIVNVIDPTYTQVYASVSGIYLYPGFDPAATASAIQQAITNFLSPQAFGAATFGDQTQWFAGTKIYYNQLIGVIQNAGRGAVRAVADGALTIGTSANPAGTVDLVIPGPLGLPLSSTTTVPLPTILSS